MTTSVLFIIGLILSCIIILPISMFFGAILGQALYNITNNTIDKLFEDDIKNN